MSEEQKQAFNAAYKVAYEAALEATMSAGYGPVQTSPSNEEEEVEISFHKIRSAWRNHWLIIVAITLCFGVLGYLYSQFLVTPKYEATSNLIVQSNTTQDGSEAISNKYVDSAKNLAKTYSQILNSSKVQNHVIRELNLDLTATELEELAVAEPVTDSQIITITVTTESSELSQSIADAYLRLAPTDLNELVEAGKCNAVGGVQVNSEPIQPGMKRSIALMAVVGFVLAFAYALFQELRNHFIITSEDVRDQLGLPVLGVVPMLEVN